MPERKRVVVAGAGFAGMRIAQGLQDTHDVTVVAPTDRFVYLPLIHEVLSENVQPPEVYRRLDEIVPKAELVHGRAERVEGQKLLTAAGDALEFDTLVVAVGAEPADYGVAGVAENALSFYSIGDALRANATIKTAASTVDGRPVRVTVVGAAFTGVEVAGEAAELLDKLEVDREILLLDALPEIFPHQNDEFRQGIYKGLDRLDLKLRTHQKITEVRPDGVQVGDEFVPSDVTFWAAGVRPRSLEGVDPNVKPTLQSATRDDVFLAGDAARFPRESGVPRLAQTAEQQAEVVVHNVRFPGKPRAYDAHVKGIIVSVGHNYAVAELKGGQIFTGNVPWHVKRTLYKAKIRFY